MSPEFIEVIIEDGTIKPVEPHQLPASGRGWLTVLSPVATDSRPKVWTETNADGLPVFHSNGPTITSEMVKEIEASTA